jgi:hypothetical protein
VPKAPRRVRLQLEGLEDRCVPANLYVTSSADDASLAGTLRYELAHANAGDSILIQVSSIVLTQGELVVTAKDLSIGPQLTAQSPNARVAISGGNHSRVFEFAFASDAPQIYNLDITGGNGLAANAFGMDYRDGQGGAVLNEANLTIYNCTFTNNSATLGGAIFNLGYDGNLTIGSSTLIKNSAQEGGGIYNYQASARVWYCKLWGNSAAQDGGALYNRGVPFPGWGWDFPPSGTLEVVGGTFYSNTAGGDGGAICNWVSNLKVSGGDFEHNQAQNGGAIINVFGTAAIDGASLLSNQVVPALPGNGQGGAIENFGRTFQVSNCEIQYNAAVAGGGICNGGGTVTVSNSTLDSNWATSAGDNVYNGKWMTITGCHLIDSSTTSYSVVTDPQGTLHVGGSTFQGMWKIKGPWINDGNNQGV